MNNTKKTPTRLEKFYEGDGPVQLKRLLNDPTMVEALSIIEEIAKPNDLLLQQMVRSHGANAPVSISLMYASLAGQNLMVNRLRNLANKPLGNEDHLDVFSQAPFAHIDENYLETK